MMLVPPGITVHLVPGFTDLRRSIDALGVLVQQALGRDPFSGQMFAFRGQRADMIKILWWDGTVLCLFMKRLENGNFPWPGPLRGNVKVCGFPQFRSALLKLLT